MAETNSVRTTTGPAGAAVPMGISVISPSFGPDAPTEAARATAPRLHAIVAPFLSASVAVAPPEPDPRAAMVDGGQRVESTLEGTGLPGLPRELFRTGDDFATQFDQLARVARDYSAEGLVKQRDALFGKMAAALTSQAQRFAKDAGAVFKAWPGMRDPGKQLLMGRVPAEVQAAVQTAVLAPVRFVLAWLEQLTPADPADDGNRLLRENVAAVLWMRRVEWSTDARLAEEVLAAWRRMQAHDRDAEFYAGNYAPWRVDRMARAWLAAANTLLQTGVLDPAFRVPLSLAFAPPDDLLAAVQTAQPTPEAVDVLAAFGLKPPDATGGVGGTRSSESMGPVRLGDAGSRPT